MRLNRNLLLGLLPILLTVACTKQYLSSPTGDYPFITFRESKLFLGDTIQYVVANGLEAVIARKGQDVDKLLSFADLSKRKFAEYNDLDLLFVDRLAEGGIYYLQPKHTKAAKAFHWAQPSQSLHDISQKYGVKLDKLFKYNRMREYDEPKAGQKIHLRTKRPKGLPTIDRSKIEPKEPKKAKPTTNGLLSGMDVNSQKTADGYDFDQVPADPNATYHTVGQEENLFRIAKLYNVTVLDLIAWNNFSSEPDQIRLAEGNLVRVKPPKMQQNTTAFQPDDAEPVILQEQGAVQQTQRQAQAPGKGKGTISNARATVQMTHIVQKGETVYQLARTYQVPAKQLMQLNGFDQSTKLKVGQQVTIPKGAAAPAGTVAANAATSTVAQQKMHTVQKGETLYQLARDYNIPVRQLMAVNGFNNNTMLKTGQQVIIGTAAGGTTPAIDENKQVRHIVKRGETLFRLSRQYGVSVEEIMEMNGLSSNEIKEGQPLMVSTAQISNVQRAAAGTPGAATDGNVVTSKTKNNFQQTAVEPPAQNFDQPAVEKPTAEGAQNYQYYEVRQEDNIYKIANKFKVQLAKLREWNGLEFGAPLPVGEKIIVGKK